jgi:hypothetical protein
MDCRTARLLFDLARPHAPELEAADIIVLEKHLAECPECGPLARAERQADELIGTAMRSVAVPEGLRTRLLDRLETEGSLASRRRWLRRTRWLAAAAAVLLVLRGGGWYWYYLHRPVVNLEDVQRELIGQRGSTPEEVTQWFSTWRNVDIVAPPQFNYAYLDSFDLIGGRVPQLIFIRGENHAYVRILSARRFNLAASLSQQRRESGGCAVDLLRHPTDPDVAYLIIYTGGSLDWLLAEGQQITV